jgi:2-aminoethylphosphonate transport system substrate-binding protein
MSQTSANASKHDQAPDGSDARESVTLYSVNGLRDGNTDWLGDLLPRFTSRTGISVHFVENHSRDTVDLLSKERAATLADVVITLPPFMQMAAEEGLLEAYKPAASKNLPSRDKHPAGLYCALVRDYPDLIYNKALATPAPTSYSDLLAPRFRGKIQYSKPGWSGAGTALLLQVFHVFGGRTTGLEFFRKLQANCLEPTAHTAGLGEMVNNGELHVANGDVQTNFAQYAANPNLQILFPKGPDGRTRVFELSYYIGLARNAPHRANGEKLIEFLLGEEAQSKVSALALGLPVRGDIVPADENFRLLTAMLKGVEIWEPEWTSIIKSLDDDVAAYDRTVLSA